MSRTWEEIDDIVRTRQLARLPVLRKMLDVRDRYNGDWVLPYPTDDDAPDLPPTTPLLIAEGIDHHGRQAGSVLPYFSVPTLDVAAEDGPLSMVGADLRRRGLKACWRASKAQKQLRRGYRHLAGYASLALSVELDPAARVAIPTFSAIDPLSVYPEEKAPEDLTPIADCALIHGKSRGWIRRTWPQSRAEYGGTVPATASTEELWDVVCWIDDTDVVYGVIGPRSWSTARGSDVSAPVTVTGTGMEIGRYPNWAGRCTVVTPWAIGLDRLVSQIGNLVGTVDLQGRLQALAVVAGEKAIFPDRYIIGHGAQAPQIVSHEGVWQDGRTGRANIVHNADSVGELRSTPDPNSLQVIDRLERTTRVSSGLVSQVGGETAGAMRTGRAMESMYAAAVDPRIQELHDTVAPELEHVNEIMLELWRNHPDCKGRRYTLFSGYGERDAFEFTPGTDIVSVENCVEYAVPGADVQGTTINLGQLTGAGLMSKDTARNRHPYIADPMAESRRILEESLEEAATTLLLTKAQSGELTLQDLARIERHTRTSHDIFAAIREAEEEVRAEQAQMPVSPDGAPLPEMQAGLSGMPAPAGQLPVPPPELPTAGPGPGEVGPTQNQQGLRALLSALSQSPTPGAPAPGAV